ncbi:DUF6603 domain-containing protein [Pseudarthrobacter sp. P1]|uniref:DUF6603 domain-containing protein n=1 Tax=Pseudarthrobacter sp. P1 TaxID=3418418 RepID=UPI003CF7B4C0
MSLDVWACAAVELPGLSLAVEKIRLSTSLAMSMKDGRLGLRLQTPAAAGPDGARAELSLPGFSGGGYLSRNGSVWSGAVEARMGPVAVSGFAILDTDHFSLLVLLAAEFTPPIQLSFGFTLVGIGGLVGINRRPDPQALQAALRSGELSALLFPRNAVSDAPRLLPALAGAFPAKDNGFVVGPMMKLGWGTPTIAAATIGFLVSDEGVVIVGRVVIALPFEDAALIRLEAMILGTIDSEGLTVGASLVDSVIVGLPVTGDMMLKTRGGSDPMFAFSAGGFHPAFTPPAGMSGLRRIGTEISPGPMLRARLGAYLAVTTNSVQFGAAAELEAKVAGFGISGGFAFDALVIFDPFGFTADFSAHVSVDCADFSVASITLDGHLSGPTPWRIRGHASISILFFDVDVDVPEITWGPRSAPELPPGRAPSSVLAQALAEPANWSVASRSVPPVAHLNPRTTAGTAAVHPLSELAFVQNAVPINLELQRMDGRPLPQPLTLRLAGDPAGPAPRFTRAPFPPSQFRELDANAKLSTSGYADADAGITVPSGVRLGQATTARDPNVPETSILDADTFFSRLRTRLDDGALAALPTLELPPRPVFVTAKRNPGDVVVTDLDSLAIRTAASGSVLAAGAYSNAALVHSFLGGLADGVQVSNVWELGF